MTISPPWMMTICGRVARPAALLTEAAKAPTTPRYGIREILAELAEIGGSRKLIGGQVMDLEGEGSPLSKRELIRIHEAKTAAWLTSSSHGFNETHVAKNTKTS